MAYCTTTAVLAILPALQADSVTTALIASHITRSDSIIDGYLSRRYSLPFSATPPLVGSLSQDLTAYLSYRSLFTRDNVNQVEYLADLNSIAMNTLQMIRDGKMDLVDTNGVLIEERGGSDRVYSTTEGLTPAFGQDDPLNWKFDENLLSSWRSRRGG